MGQAARQVSNVVLRRLSAMFMLKSLILGLFSAVTAAGWPMKNFVRRTLIDERDVIWIFDLSGLGPGGCACVDVTPLSPRFCHHRSISLR
jgi:hypothetical protein